MPDGNGTLYQEPRPSTALTLNPALDADRLAVDFAANRRVQVADFLLPDSAVLLRSELLGRHDWQRVIHGGGRVFETPTAEFDAMPPSERAVLDSAIIAAAASGFQFSYDTIRVPDLPALRTKRGTLLDEFAVLMSAPATLALLCRIAAIETGDVGYADAQATRYRAGDFLTRHDDQVTGKNRQLAYVLAMSPEWRPDWGGLLLFEDATGRLVDAFAPRFNALSLFAVPQPHSVSYVAPFAPHPRLAVTGWIRHGEAI